ncbi:MAG: TrkH family potassium uptake protein [Peptoniphilus sp.]|uniref:TrkH family potassium uptake protein n=1 Tax=Peptoniphilus sp. TaxID=1971214 RepID=UPI0025CDAE3B|nr:TrkH family potassium uptake protein [Peptoniphilus sp.]MCI5642563.1 TrkH family potassium uptake protein [Peptoniphilus sp.]MDD7352401.1 TrkH family potassium uptake protein [Peptoniphilaceae bacterium]MDY3902665.1 TrkH family potassium uptake protein [Peptoniphilus sp.]
MIRKLKKNPPLIVCLSFFALIFFGACLLDLPIASANGERIGFLDAFFTSTSASCVTGLIVANTASQWTVFGKVVIILLIQIGGLGTMVFLSLVAMVFNKRIGITERRIIREQTNADTSKGIIRLVIYIIKFSLSVELIGAILLATKFIPDFGIEKGILFSIFHSISAFCNAGFDITGNSLIDYVSDFTVNIAISLLIIFGGLGFTVFIDIYRKKNFKNLNLHSKIVTSVTAILILVGTIAFFLIEHNGSAMEGLTLKGKVLSSFFMSVTARTAGFNSIDISKMQESSLIVTIMLMFIGASPASTGGGIKTTTFGVLLFSTISFLRGNKETEIFHKTISHESLIKSLCIFTLSSALIIFSSLLITINEQGKFLYLDILYEIVSAFGTVGISRGITANLSSLSKIVLIILMYLGRVGAATLGIGILNRKTKKHTRYSEGKIIVG